VYTFGAGNKGQLGHTVEDMKDGSSGGAAAVGSPSSLAATTANSSALYNYETSEFYPKRVECIKHSRRIIHEVYICACILLC
jgi:hypothetical protein